MSKTDSHRRQALLDGLLRHDHSVIDPFYQSLYLRVERYLRWRYPEHERQLLEDCFSEAFLLLWAKVRESGFENNRLFSFAFGIVLRCFKNTVKKYRQKACLDLESLPPGRIITTDQPLPIGEKLPLDQLDDHWVAWYGQLPTREQALLQLRYQRYSQEQVAGILGLSHGTVRNLYSKLQRKVREHQRA